MPVSRGYMRAGYPLLMAPFAQALPCPSTGAHLTVVFLTGPAGFLLWALPCLSTGPHLTVVFLTFSVLAQGGRSSMVSFQDFCGSSDSEAGVVRFSPGAPRCMRWVLKAGLVTQHPWRCDLPDPSRGGRLKEGRDWFWNPLPPAIYVSSPSRCFP